MSGWSTGASSFGGPFLPLAGGTMTGAISLANVAATITSGGSTATWTPTALSYQLNSARAATDAVNGFTINYTATLGAATGTVFRIVSTNTAKNIFRILHNTTPNGTVMTMTNDAGTDTGIFACAGSDLTIQTFQQVTASASITIKTAASTGAASGAVAISTGLATAADSGLISLTTGTPGTAQASGAINLTTGAGGSSSGVSGTIALTTGATTSGVAGAINLTVGNSGATSNGGGITLATGRAGTSAGTQGGGAFTVTTGAGGPSGSGGDCTLNLGDGGATAGAGGTFTLTGGDGVAGGTLSLTAGNSTTGTAGAINITSGTASGASGTGGAITITGGDSTSGNSGNIAISSGATTGAVNTGTISLSTGAVVLGTTGSITFTTGAGTTSGGITLTVGTGSTTTGSFVVAGAANYTLTALGVQTMISTDAGATGAPDLVLFRNSASAAANDVMGRIIFDGNSATPTRRTMGVMQSVIVTATDGAEDAKLEFYTIAAGASNLAVWFAETGQIHADLGAGTGNVTVFDDYDDVGLIRSVFNKDVERRERGLNELAQLGLVSRKQGGSGWAIALQPWIALLSGGIYQTADRVEQLVAECAMLRAQIAVLAERKI